MGDGTQMLLVRLVNDGGRHGGRHLDRDGLALVIHPQLDEVDALGGLLIDQRAAFLGRGNRIGHPYQAAITALDHRAPAGAEEARHGRAALALLVAQVQHEILVGAQHLHRGHAVSRILLQVGGDILGRLVFLVLGNVVHHADMDMAVDDARHHELARQILGLRAGRRLQPGHRPDIGDLAVGHHDGAVGLGSGARAVDHRDMGQDRGFRQSGTGRQQGNGCDSELQSMHLLPRMSFFGRVTCLTARFAEKKAQPLCCTAALAHLSRPAKKIAALHRKAASHAAGSPALLFRVPIRRAAFGLFAPLRHEADNVLILVVSDAFLDPSR